MNTIAGHMVNVVAHKIKNSLHRWRKIVNLKLQEAVPDQYIIPGFVDTSILKLHDIYHLGLRVTVCHAAQSPVFAIPHEK